MTTSDFNSLSLEHAIFFVENEPYCLWSYQSITERTLRFLYNINPSYFEYQADTNLKKLNTKKYEQQAALAIRTAYSHGLETLFSLLCAAVQSPHCVPGWLLLCSNTQLYRLVEKIDSRQQVYSLLNPDRLNWQKLSLEIHKPLILKDKKEEKSIKKHFGELWSRWAADFLGETFRKEYNSIKHGFRVTAGGFSLSIGGEITPGVHPPQENMQLIGELYTYYN